MILLYEWDFSGQICCLGGGCSKSQSVTPLPLKLSCHSYWETRPLLGASFTWAQYFKTCNPDHDNPDNEILLFSVLDQGDPANFIRVFQNTGRVDHRDPDLGGDGFPNLVTSSPDRKQWQTTSRKEQLGARLPRLKCKFTVI